MSSGSAFRFKYFGGSSSNCVEHLLCLDAQARRPDHNRRRRRLVSHHAFFLHSCLLFPCNRRGASKFPHQPTRELRLATLCLRLRSGTVDCLKDWLVSTRGHHSPRRNCCHVPQLWDKPALACSVCVGCLSPRYTTRQK